MNRVDVINPNPHLKWWNILKECAMSMAQSLSMKMMMELILNQFSMHVLSKCLQLLINNLSMVEGDYVKPKS